MDMNLYSKKPKYKKILKSILIWILEIAIVILSAYLIIEYAVEKTTMLGASMETTLKDGDKIIVNKLAYLKNGPKRYDVIVFKQSGKEHSYYNIKRVIGIPGDTIEITDGLVYINGTRLEEEIPVEPMRLSGLAAEPITLEEDEYFVLGDNRNASEDSRFANIGLVVREDIIGEAWLRLSPFSIVGKINRED
ncbi:MAG: signal peptidase I [Lachnospiraceae bacterium]